MLLFMLELSRTHTLQHSTLGLMHAMVLLLLLRHHCRWHPFITAQS